MLFCTACQAAAKFAALITGGTAAPPPNAGTGGTGTAGAGPPAGPPPDEDAECPRPDLDDDIVVLSTRIS